MSAGSTDDPDEPDDPDEADESADADDAQTEGDDDTHACPRHADVAALGACERCGNYYCDRCLDEADLPAGSPRCAACPQPVPVAPPIGGWLALPAFGLMVRPFVLLYGIASGFDMVQEAAPDIVAPIALEIVLNVGMLAFSVYTGICFLQKRRRTVPLVIGLYALTMVVALIDEMIVAHVDAITGYTTPSDPALARAIGSGIVWIAYFLSSQRVKDTFVMP